MNTTSPQHLCKKFLCAAVLLLLLDSRSNAQTLSNLEYADPSDFESIGYVPPTETASASYFSLPGWFLTGFGGYVNAYQQAYVSFSTTGLSPVSNLSIYVSGNTTGGLPDHTTTLNLFLYTSSVAPTGDAASFNSMISGPLIGSYSIPQGIGTLNPTFELNSVGVSAFNQAVADGTSFAVTTELSGVGPTAGGDLFDNSTDGVTDYVILQTDPTAVPEPFSWALITLGIGLFGLLCIRTRRTSLRGAAVLLVMLSTSAAHAQIVYTDEYANYVGDIIFQGW